VTAPRERAWPIRFDETERIVWGDERSGQVVDRTFMSSRFLDVTIFSLAPGAGFGHSEDWPTVYGADQLYCILRGRLFMTNPETGETHRLHEGEALFLRKDTWHHALNHGPEEVAVLEFFAPGPTAGTGDEYARSHAPPEVRLAVQVRWLGRWPIASEEAPNDRTMRFIGPDDLLWMIEGTDPRIPLGFLISTEHLTVGRMELLSGQVSEPHRHAGEETAYLLRGTLRVQIPSVANDPASFSVEAGDGFHVQAGVEHRYQARGDGSCEFIFGVAPSYLPDPAGTHTEHAPLAPRAKRLRDDGGPPRDRERS
jgi:quercetin dioxygenase-like cupin family protein